MFDTNHQLQDGSAAQTLSLTAPTLDDALSRELLELAIRLRLILPVIGVSVMALRRQDAEADADIASVLSESAWLPLDSEIERVESILEATRLASHAAGGACVNQQELLPGLKPTLKSRRLIVGYGSTATPGVDVPYLRLRGRWLQEAGFAIGRHVRIELSEGRMTIELLD
jgi:hypothetical protein